jgi:hypothetical protein
MQGTITEDESRCKTFSKSSPNPSPNPIVNKFEIEFTISP